MGFFENLLKADEGIWNQHLKNKYGPINGMLVCPHCGVKGKIHVKPTTQKRGIDGGKATAAVFTCGLSMLLTGLSRMEKANKLYCESCEMMWVV